jgi:hypothetical protein
MLDVLRNEIGKCECVDCENNEALSRELKKELFNLNVLSTKSHNQ